MLVLLNLKLDEQHFLLQHDMLLVVHEILYENKHFTTHSNLHNHYVHTL